MNYKAMGALRGGFDISYAKALKSLRMEVPLTSDQQTIAHDGARPRGGTLVQEALEHFLNYDEWFWLEVDKGFAAADRGEFVEHGDIRKIIDSRYPA
ncbi:MAG: hypothetical protein JO076_12000 [Verrucomicrobia bacterium]|nr:hypothetical protein [Verrucomicrobiota bacterium]